MRFLDFGVQLRGVTFSSCLAAAPPRPSLVWWSRLTRYTVDDVLLCEPSAYISRPELCTRPQLRARGASERLDAQGRVAAPERLRQVPLADAAVAGRSGLARFASHASLVSTLGIGLACDIASAKSFMLA